MEREAAFLEIQRERKLYEDTFNSQVSDIGIATITILFFLPQLCPCAISINIYPENPKFAGVFFFVLFERALKLRW